MSAEALHLVPYGLLAALSPVGFAATLAVIGSGRLTAFAFACAFVAGQLLACGILVLIGTAATTNRASKHPTLQAILELGLGLALLLLAVRVRRRPPSTGESSGRTKKALARLGRLHVATALVAGGLLGIGGPKRLVLSALAATSIAASGSDTSQEIALVGWYTLLATTLVWIPIFAFEVRGEAVVKKLDAAQRWTAEHQRPVVFYALLVLGAVFLVEGLVAVL